MDIIVLLFTAVFPRTYKGNDCRIRVVWDLALMFSDTNFVLFLYHMLVEYLFVNAVWK